MKELLAKYAARSEQLRRMALSKESGVLGAIGAVGKMAVKNPIKTVTAVGSAAEARGKYRQFKTGFDPAVQSAMLGQVPTPPGGS